MARERCNELCTKATTGACTLCDKLDEADEFIRFYFKGGWLLKVVNFYLVNTKIDHLNTVLEEHTGELESGEFLVVTPGRIRVAGRPHP